MALSASVNITVNPYTLTIVSDKRVLHISGSVHAAGDDAAYVADAVFPITIQDDQNHSWSKVSDDNQTAVYSY